MSEASKPQTIARRVEQGFLPLVGNGLDVGAGPDPSYWTWWTQFPESVVRPWDLGDGDAHDLLGIPNGSLDWVFSSHCLEHLDAPGDALHTWVQAVKPGGKLVISVPHRDLYEGRHNLPSYWNHEHLRFYVPERVDVGGSPDTIAFGPWLRDMGKGLGFQLARLEVGDRDCVPAEVPGRHAAGEYCIDALLIRANR